MISVRDLTFSYDAKPVLEHLSFSVPEGGLTALLGCNGTGKTTLFRCMLGIQPHYSGEIDLDGRELRQYSASQLASKIAYIPQNHYPAFNYSVLDMVLMGTTQQLRAFASPGPKQIRLAEEAMARLGISALSYRDYMHLSGGEKQLVLIARALAQQAPILLMDEPTASLDFGNQLRVMDQVRQLSHSGYTVVMSTHNPQHALSYCDRVLALKSGRVQADGTPEDVIDEALMEALYGVSVQFEDTLCGRIIMAASGHK